MWHLCCPALGACWFWKIASLLAAWVGEKVSCLAALAGVRLDKLVLKNCGDRLPNEGSVEELDHALGLDAASVATSIEEVLHEQ